MGKRNSNKKECGVYENKGEWLINWYENDDYRKFRQEKADSKKAAFVRAKELGFTHAVTKPGDSRGFGRIVEEVA